MASQSAHKLSLPPIKSAQPPRMRPALREAVTLIITKGLTQRDAALRAGMNETALSRALLKPHIKTYVEAQKALFATDMLQLKDRAKSIAIATGIELMHSAQSEAVRARMVELFAGDAKSGPAVAVQVNVDRGGYDFVPKGAKMVRIVPPQDEPSGAESAQDAEIIDDGDEIGT